jgi:hypothetical protein
VSFLSDEINYLEAVASYIVGTLAPGILDELHGLERWVVGAIDGAVADLRTWVIDDIASPLLDAIAAEGARVDDLIAHGLDTVRGEIADAVDNETLRRIAAVAALAAVVAAITDFVDNCGQPMCDVMGPKTDLGKLLKGLQAALLAADLAALLAMDEAELEATIAKLVTRGGQAISAFDEFFVGGTETIGDVIGNL